MLTIEEVRDIIGEPLTPNQEYALMDYVANGTIPPADPCLSCDPTVIRKYISKLRQYEPYFANQNPEDAQEDNE